MTTHAPQTLPIPASHLDLLTRPICRVLTTMGGDGQPQSSLVWADWDGTCARVNTTLERQKGRNLVANPKVSLLVVDPDNTARYIQIRGDAELVTDGALDHLDKLTRKYTRHPAYYGHIYPVAQRRRETPSRCRPGRLAPAHAAARPPWCLRSGDPSGPASCFRGQRVPARWWGPMAARVRRAQRVSLAPASWLRGGDGSALRGRGEERSA
jgi:PPOX class probable F420-dependent enzyme